MPIDTTQAVDFIHKLWPSGGPEGAYLVLSHVGDSGLISKWTTLPEMGSELPAWLNQYAPKYNTYFGVGLRDSRTEPSSTRRGGKHSVYALPGFVFDADDLRGTHKQDQLPADENEAVAFFHSLPWAPSLIVDSSGGTHAYWLFDTPFLIQNETQRDEISALSKRFHRSIKEQAQKQHGWDLDTLHQIDIILRLPGSLNHKSGTPKVVTVLHESGDRYSVDDIKRALPPQQKKEGSTQRNRDQVRGDSLDVMDVTRAYGKELTQKNKSRGEWEGAHPEHDSTTGDNFNVRPSKNVWHCYRHGTGGDALMLIAVCEGLITCQEAESGVFTNRQDLFRRVVEIANEKFNAGIPWEEKPKRERRASRVRQDGHQEKPTPNLLHYSCDDLGNSYRYLALHGENLRFCAKWGSYLAWTDTHWEESQGAAKEYAKDTVELFTSQAKDYVEKGAAALPQEGDTVELSDTDTQKAQAKAKKQVDIAEAMLHWAKKTRSAAGIGNMMSLAQSDPNIAIKIEQMNADPWLLNVRNGTLNLKDSMFHPHKRDDRITYTLDVDYDPAATCPRWEQFLCEIFSKDQALIDYVQQACGYSITGSVAEQVMFILWGTGSNGKSTFMECLRGLLGPLAYKAPSDLFLVSKHEPHPTGKTNLFGRRLVISQETGEGRRLDETWIKEATGGDAISARRMHEDFWDFKPTHKLWLATNHKPKIYGTEHGIWRRLLLIPFTRKFEGKDIDKALPEKLQAEWPGILAWCVRGCQAWLEKDGLETPAAVQNATAEYRKDQDVLQAFMDDSCYIDLDDDKVSIRKDSSIKTKAAVLYAAYTDWCKQGGEYARSKREFGVAMTERGFKRQRNNGSWYLGIGVLQKNDSDDSDDDEEMEEWTG